MGYGTINIGYPVKVGKAGGVAGLDESGKVPADQLPAMDYDPAGSAQKVQEALTGHINDKENPHGVTAEQVGADPAGSSKAVQQALTTHTSNKQNPHGVTAAQVGAYTRAQTLQAATAGLFGLSGSATPDDVLAYVGKYAQHWWMKVPITYQEVQNPESTVRLVDWDDDAGQKRTIYYADSIEINPSNGEISLKNEASFVASYDGYSSIIGVIKNKYIRNAYIEPESVFYIPDGATVSSTSAVGVSIKDSMKVSSAAMPDYNSPEYVQSSSRSAYPDSGIRDGYEYLYLGIPLDNAVSAKADALKMSTGSYVGTGTDSNKITLGVKPKFLVIVRGSDSVSNSNVIMAVFGSQGGMVSIKYSASNSAYSNITFQEDGFTLTSNNQYDMNKSGVTFYYTAFC